MLLSLLLVFVSTILTSLGPIRKLGVLALSPTFQACQFRKTDGMSQTEGCPGGTIFVSPTDPSADFTSVQDAVSTLQDEGQAYILIGEGEYEETVNVTRTGPLTMLGQLDPTTALLPSSNASTRNLATIFNSLFVTTALNITDDAQTSVLLVAPSLSASLIGSGTDGAPLQPLFGNVDFKSYNLNWENRAANFSISQALVTDVSYANASFYGCAFKSYQDTWYTGRNASTYVVDSEIFGMTDYLFGFGTAWFENVTLANRGCGGGIVAWKGSNQTFAPGNRYGAYINNSTIRRSPDANATLDLTDDCFLGRPWNDLATTVYMRTFMDDTIQPAGWTPFDSARPTIMNTTFYAEFDNRGPGSNTSERVSDHILTMEQAENFTLEKVFLEMPQWIDFSYVVE